MKSFSLSTILGLAFGILLTGYAVFAFQAPAQAPPEGNVPAPLNTGSSDQTKIGGLLNVFGLWVNQSLGVTGGATLGGILNLQGNRITNVGDPMSAGDVTTKGYEDSRVDARGFSGVTVYNSSGSFTVPPGVTSILVEAFGGGGGGGGGAWSYCYQPGSGGGGSSYGKGIVSVTPGASYTVTVGSGGAGGIGSGGNAFCTTTPPGSGGDSSFLTVIAGGGKGTSGGTSSAPFNIAGEPGNPPPGGSGNQTGGLGGKGVWGLGNGGKGGDGNGNGSPGAPGRVVLTY